MRALKRVLWAFLLWTAIGLFFASGTYFQGARWPVALAWSMPQWYIWGLLTPLIMWVDRRFLANLSLRSRVALHVPLGIAWTLFSIWLRLITRELRGLEPADSTLGFFLDRFYWDTMIYAVIAGVSISRDLAGKVRDRDLLERRLVEARFQSLRAQLQPHFLFNALNTISAFTETSPQTARRMMEQLGTLLRATLTHASEPLVTLGEELTFLDDYLAIESARFEGRIAVSVQADDDLLDLKVPGFVLQPIVDNAIRHGVAPRVSGGRVEVTATRNGPMLSLRVRDDGVGLPAGWKIPEKNGHVGLRNVAARLEHLYGRTDLLRITPVATGGVDVQIDIPVETR
jgi:two-component system LytT family sensor kinase